MITYPSPAVVFLRELRDLLELVSVEDSPTPRDLGYLEALHHMIDIADIYRLGK